MYAISEPCTLMAIGFTQARTDTAPLAINSLS